MSGRIPYLDGLRVLAIMAVVAVHVTCMFYTNTGISELVFVIGSSCGLSKKVSARADLKMSMSKMTFLHQFARLILVEQIYRAFKIMKGEKYHK